MERDMDIQKGVEGMSGAQVDAAASGGNPQDGPSPGGEGSPQAQNPSGNGQPCSTGANPGQTGPTGMPIGQTGYQPGGAGGYDPYGQGGMTGMGPYPGQSSGMNQGGIPGGNPGQIAFYPPGQPGTSVQGQGPMMGGSTPFAGSFQPGQAQVHPGMNPMASPGMYPGQTAYYSGGYPGAPGAQGQPGMIGNPMNSHTDHSMGGQSSGHMGADAQHIYHDENRFGKVADIAGRFLKGEANTSDIVDGLFSLNFRNDQFWKGAIVGVLAALLLSSETVKHGVATAFGSGSKKTEDKTSDDKKAGKTSSKNKDNV